MHQPIEVLVPYPARISVPDLPNRIGIWIDLLNHPAKLSPKVVIIDFRRDIQTPAVSTLLNPVLRNPDQIIPHIRVFSIQFGQIFDIPPGFVFDRFAPSEGIQREAVDVIPFFVAGLGAIIQQVGKGKESSPAVVENAVQDDAHPIAVGNIKQGMEILQRP